MIAALICAFSLAIFLQFFVSYCRSILASSRKVALSDRVREVTSIADHEVAADDFNRLLQLVRLCPERGDDQSEIRAVGTYYGLLEVLSRVSTRMAPGLAGWFEQERQNCSYFAAVALDRRISYSRDLYTQQTQRSPVISGRVCGRLLLPLSRRSRPYHAPAVNMVFSQLAAGGNRPMRTPLEQSVLNTIRHSRMLIAGNRVGVAVSGGADSLALLALLARLRDELGITLAVVHFNHALRGAESDADAAFVERQARNRGLDFFVEREDVAAAAAQYAWNLEDAARRLRYAFFERVMNQSQLTHIAVAHTADDQAETVLAHLLRGTGPTGLAGIHPVVHRIVRPLLGTRRENLREYLRANGQTWREDSSNRDSRRTRAHIREKLLPLIEEDFSPAIVGHLSQLARLAREEGDVLGRARRGSLPGSRPAGRRCLRIAACHVLRRCSSRSPQHENPHR